MLLYLIFLVVVTVVDNKVCKSLDVRNTPDHISEFQDCRVIQGSLQVVLMEISNDSSDYIGKSFTNLTEITDYLIVFRIMGLTSLRSIFPKLTTIKGENLFMNYSLILYDSPALEEIGLPTLQKIERGKVKIDSCPNLCYVDTLNWTSFGVADFDVDYDRPKGCDKEECPRECRGYCWNNHDCQTYKKNFCHDACLGCTRPNSPKHCLLCKYYNNSGTCVRSCPSNKIVDELNICIKPSQCISKKWSLYQNTCVKTCPFGKKRNLYGKCIPSYICKGLRITNKYELSQMVGCNHIDGSLELTLENLRFEDLEKAFENVESISEYLKITRSYYITTLSFFKKLQKIEGKKLWSLHYSIFVNENLNLQKLFVNNSKIKIERGEALIQENPNLCLESNFTVKTLSYENGKECNATAMRVTIVERNPTNMILEWEDDDVRLPNYVVYYIKEKDNVGYKLRDFVDVDDNWMSVYVTNSTVFLKSLTPFTRYCYFIKTVENHKQTPVECFRTATGDPSDPQDLKVDSQTESTIKLSWKAPHYLNGEISHYELAVYTLRYYLPKINQRDYCLHPPKEQKYSKCSCHPKKELMILTKDNVCFDKSSFSCEKNLYHTDKLRIERSLSDIITDISEYKINDTEFVLKNLTPSTLYTFYLKACNKKDGDENYHCGGIEMISQRTEPSKTADSVSGVTIENDTLFWKKPEKPNTVVVAYSIEIKGNNSTYACVRGDKCCQYRISVQPGKYMVRVAALTLVGPGEFSEWKPFIFENKSDDTAADWGYGVLVLVAILLILGAVLWRRYKKRRINVDSLVTRVKTEEDGWKLDDETVEIIRELGENSIGVFYRNK